MNVRFAWALGLLGATALSAAAAAADLDAIKKKAELVAITTGDDRPNVYIDESGKPAGFEAEMCKAIAAKIGVKLNLTPMAWEGILPSLSTGRTDVVCSAVNITAARMKVFDYSNPYSRTAIVAVVPTDNTDIKGPMDIGGKIVGGVLGADGEDIIRQIGGFKEISVYPGTTEEFADFVAKRLDVMIMGDIQANAFIKARPGIAKIVGKPYKVNYVGYPLPKGSDALLATINEAIKDMRESGKLNALASQYLGVDNFTDALPPVGESVKF